MTSPWMAMPVSCWPDIAEALCGVWPRSAAIMDLRWHDDQIRVGRLKKMPSRRVLMSRWQWSDHHVRSLLRDEPLWADSHHKSPNDLPAISQTSPRLETKGEVEPVAVSQQSPNDLPNISTRADLHTTHNTQHIPPKVPQGGSEQISLSGDSIKALWTSMEAIRCEARGKGKPRKLDGARRRTLKARVDEYSAAEILTVARWVWSSEHDRAVMLRDPRYDYKTMLRPSKFSTYLDLATEPETVNPIASKTSGLTSGLTADAAWAVMEQAMEHWQRTPPHTAPAGWTFADTDDLEDRYVEALKRTTDRSNLSAAWAHLYNKTGDANKSAKLRRSFGYHWRTLGREIRQGVAA